MYPLVVDRFRKKKKIRARSRISIKSVTQAHKSAEKRGESRVKKKARSSPSKARPKSAPKRRAKSPKRSTPRPKATPKVVPKNVAPKKKSAANGKTPKQVNFKSKLHDSIKPIAQFSVGYLQILNEKGAIVNKAWEPKLPKETLIEMYKVMQRARKWDDKSLALQRSGRQGTYAPSMGQEGAQVGSIFALEKTDWAVPAFREAAMYLARGVPMSSMFLYNMGSEDGSKGDPAMRTLPVAIPVGSQTLHATGIAMASKIKGEKDVTIVYFGDGASSEGESYEALNFAGAFQAPVIFLCQNNQWAISTPRSKQSHAQTLAQKGIAGGLPCIQVDGNDPLAVYVATKDAVDRARAGAGPTFIEAVTYRLRMHTTADDPKRYRTDAEVEAWMKKDPIIRFKKYLETKRLWSAKDEEALQAEIEAEIAEGVKIAEAHEPNPEDMFTSVYATPTAPLIEQMEMLKERLERRQGS